MKIVLDANVLICALLWPDSKPASVYEASVHQTILLSERVRAEYDRVFRKTKFDRYTDLGKRLAFLDTVCLLGELIDIHETIQSCRDPDDDKYLELAVSGGADVIVSGDDDLLILHPFRDIPILSPTDFLAWLPT